MVFLKRSITVLLVAIFISLASILTTEKTHAQELVKSECPLTQYLSVAKKPCVKVPPKQKLFLKEQLIPTPEPKKEEKKEEATPQITFSPQNFTPAPTGTLSADVLFTMINEHRASISLPAYQKEAQVCGVAEGRREEITQEIFVTGALHAGFWSDNHPFWATENMIWQHTETEAMNWWLNSPVHRSAIEGDYLYACGTCNGEVCNMIFSSLTPKATQSATFAVATTPKVEVPKQATPTVKPEEALSKTLQTEKNRLGGTLQVALP